MSNNKFVSLFEGKNDQAWTLVTTDFLNTSRSVQNLYHQQLSEA